jgi:Protein of unknown function (DUF3037)
MKTYQYQILRFIPDRVTGEFVNVGIVFFEPETAFFKCKLISRYERVTNYFSDVNPKLLASILKQFEYQIFKKGEQIKADKTKSLYLHRRIEEITTPILAFDEGALVLTEARSGVDIDVEQAFDDLFNRIIDKYNLEQSYLVFYMSRVMCKLQPKDNTQEEVIQVISGESGEISVNAKDGVVIVN